MGKLSTVVLLLHLHFGIFRQHSSICVGNPIHCDNHTEHKRHKKRVFGERCEQNAKGRRFLKVYCILFDNHWRQRWEQTSSYDFKRLCQSPFRVLLNRRLPIKELQKIDAERLKESLWVIWIELNCLYWNNY